MESPQINLNLKQLVPAKNSVRQLLITIVGIVIAFAAYYFFTDGSTKYTDELYKQQNQQLEQRIENLRVDLQLREKAFDDRQDSLLILENKLLISKNEKRKLKNQLYNAKKKLQESNDSDNLTFFIDYNQQFRARNKD
jgi:hypothetical protein